MTTKPMPWSLKGVSLEAREAAKAAAAAEDLPIGAWLSGIIHEVAAAERAHGDTAAVGQEAGTSRIEPRMSSIERAMSRFGDTSPGG